MLPCKSILSCYDDEITMQAILTLSTTGETTMTNGLAYYLATGPLTASSNWYSELLVALLTERKAKVKEGFFGQRKQGRIQPHDVLARKGSTGPCAPSLCATEKGTGSHRLSVGPISIVGCTILGIRGWFFSNPLKCFFGVSSGKCLDFAQSLASDLHAALPLYWWPDKPERSAVMVQSLAPNYRVEVRGKDLANHSFGGSIRSKGGGWRVRTIARGWGSIPSSRSISKR
jgi:hypothetical protein